MATTNNKVFAFEQLEHLVECARRLLYCRALSNTPFDEEFLPLTWLIEAHSTGKYENLLKVWDSGLESMHGKSLIGRCIEIIVDNALGGADEPVHSHLTVVK